MQGLTSNFSSYKPFPMIHFCGRQLGPPGTVREEEDGGFDWTLTADDVLDPFKAASSCWVVIGTSS